MVSPELKFKAKKYFCSINIEETPYKAYDCASSTLLRELVSVLEVLSEVLPWMV